MLRSSLFHCWTTSRTRSSLPCLRAAPRVFSERSARRTGASGTPGAAGSAWIRRHRRESLTWDAIRREAADKGVLCKRCGWRVGAGSWCLETQRPLLPGVAAPAAPQGARLFHANLKPSLRCGARYSRPRTRALLFRLPATAHSDSLSLSPPLLSFWGGRRLTPRPAPGTSVCFFRVAYEPWSDR